MTRPTGEPIKRNTQEARGATKNPSLRCIPGFRLIGAIALLSPVAFDAAPAQEPAGAAQGIAQAMLASGQVTPEDLAVLQAAVGPDQAEELAQVLQDSGIRILPGEARDTGRPALLPVQAGADWQDDEAAHRRDLENRSTTGWDDFWANTVPTGEILRGPIPGGARAAAPARDSLPGSARVPLERIEAAAAAEVRGRGRAQRALDLRHELPEAYSQAQALTNDLDDRIQAIDRFLAHPYRNAIIGPIEGRIPRMLQTPARAAAQVLFDSITSNLTLNRLIQDRQMTETGASPQGLLLNRDLAIAARAISQLSQTASEAAVMREMRRLRETLLRTRQQALHRYNAVYRDLLKEHPAYRLRAVPHAGAGKPDPRAEPSLISPELARKYGL